MAMPDNSDDDEPLRLPTDTLALLNDFLSEKEAKAKQFETLKSAAEDEFTHRDAKLSMDLFGEDWQVSQFWYTDATATILARALLEGATSETRIAVVSAPSAYIALRNLLIDMSASERPEVRLLEYDQRFAVLGSDFVPYDFQHPLKLPAELKGRFDRILCDPPFLSEDCQTKTALSVRFLAKSWEAPSGSNVGGDGLRLISCTGERMEGAMLKLYGKIGMRTTDFEPEHGKGLSNEFRCYANFEWEGWRWR